MQFKLHHPHPWAVSPKEAVAIQRELAGKVRVEPLSAEIRYIAGVDVSVRGETLQTAIVVIDLALPAGTTRYKIPEPTRLAHMLSKERRSE